MTAEKQPDLPNNVVKLSDRQKQNSKPSQTNKSQDKHSLQEWLECLPKGSKITKVTLPPLPPRYQVILKGFIC